MLIYNISKAFSTGEEYTFKVPFKNTNYSVVVTQNRKDISSYYFSVEKYNNKIEIWHNGPSLTLGVIAIGKWK